MTRDTRSTVVAVSRRKQSGVARFGAWRFVRPLALVLVPILVLAGGVPAEPADPPACPKLIHEIYAEAGTRFDKFAYDAKRKAADAARLHREGRHTEATAIAHEGRRLLGLPTPVPQPTR